jgi:hypothetical protein
VAYTGCVAGKTACDFAHLLPELAVEMDRLIMLDGILHRVTRQCQECAYRI